MLIKILALSVLLVLLLNSASFIQVDALNAQRKSKVSDHAGPKLPCYGLVVEALSKRSRLAHHQRKPKHIPFFLVLIFVLNNKSTMLCRKHSLL